MSSRISTLHLKPWAIVLGCLADFGVTLVGGIVITLIAFVNVGDPTDVAGLESTLQSTGLQAAGLVLGLLATVLGGYLAARKSPDAELTNALAVGVVMTLLGVLLQVIFRTPFNLWSVIGFVTMIPAALGGGFLRVSQLEQSTATD